MKINASYLLLLFVTLIALTGCKKDSNSDVTLFGKWKIEGYVANSSSLAQTATTDVYLTFYNNKTIAISLEVNACSGTFSLDASSLTIKDATCTETCCDSDFSLELMNLIPLVESHHFTNNQLNLTGSDFLKIRLNKE
jgi:heat shock protein HslJ